MSARQGCSACGMGQRVFFWAMSSPAPKAVRLVEAVSCVGPTASGWKSWSVASDRRWRRMLDPAKGLTNVIVEMEAVRLRG